MIEAVKRVLGAYAQRICFCEGCGRRARVSLGKEARCPHCSKTMRPVLGTY